MAAKRPFKKEVLKVGEWNYKGAPGGKLKFTREKLQTFAENFKKHNPFIPVIRGHQPQKRVEENPNLIIASNILDMQVEGDSLFATWEMEPEEAEKYADISVSIQPDYEDHRTGEQVGDIIEHIAMVVSPYLKNLSSFVPLGERAHEPYLICLSEITMSEESNKVEETVETPVVEVEAPKAETEAPELPAETKAEEKEEQTTEEVVAELEKREEVVEEKPVEEVPATPSESSEDVKAQLAEALTQLAEANKKLRASDAEGLYNKLLSEGRITPAAKQEFITLAEFGAEQTIQLSDKTISFSDAFVSFLNKLPKVINLKERGIVTEDKPSKVSVEFREQLFADQKLRNPNLTEEELDKYIDENLETLQAFEQKKFKKVNS